MKTNVLNQMLSFNKGNNCNSNKHLQTVLTSFSRQVGENDFVVHEGWLTPEIVKGVLPHLKKYSIRNIYLASLVDEFSHFCDDNTKYLKKICNEVVIVGNTSIDSLYYYSFWLDYAYTYRENFMSFDATDIHKSMKTYMSLNRKPHRHRFLLWRKLQDKKLGKHGHLSFSNLQNLKVDVPTTGTVDKDWVIPNDISSLGLPENWNTHFLNIVTETNHTDNSNVFFSEKSFKPIIGHRPFMILGDSGIYSSLHKLGFDTFDDILGTGYKSTTLTSKIDWIIDVIQSLKKENKVKLYKKILPRLEENYKVFLKVGNENRKKRDNLCR